jgi:hypothetical protein
MGLSGKLNAALSDILSRQKVDWNTFTRQEVDALIGMARAEGVAPLLYDFLFLHPADTVSIPHVHLSALSSLSADYYNTAAQNALLFNELDRIVAVFCQEHVGAIVLKGAHLAQTIYPDPALRPMSDLDLLVHPADLKRASQQMIDLGYAIESVEAAPGLNQRLSHHICLRQSQPPHLVVELHYRLAGSDAFVYSSSGDWLWENASPWVEKYPALETARVLAPTTHLLYLLAHAVLQHGGEDASLLWYYDVALLLERQGPQIDWPALALRARQLGWGSAVAAGLHAVQGRFGVKFPPEAQSCLAVVSDGSTDLVQRGQQRSRTRWELEVRKLLSLTWSARLALVAALIFPTPAYMRWRYHPHPEWLWPMYYPYRWGDVLVDFLKTLWIARGKTR